MNCHQLVTKIAIKVIQIRMLSSGWQIPKTSVFQSSFYPTAVASKNTRSYACPGHYRPNYLPSIVYPAPIPIPVYPSANPLDPTSGQVEGIADSPHRANRYKLKYSGPLASILACQIPDSTMFYNAITITDSVPRTWFGVINLGMAHFEMYHSDQTDDKMAFTILDLQYDPSWGYSSEPELVKKADDVEIQPFLDGLKTIRNYWIKETNSPTVEVVVTAKEENDGYTYYSAFVSAGGEKLKFFATIRRLNPRNFSQNYFDFYITGEYLSDEKSATRSAVFDPWIRQKSLTSPETPWTPVQEAAFSFFGKDNDTEVKCEVKDEYFHLGIGAETTKSVNRSRASKIPPTLDGFNSEI